MASSTPDLLRIRRNGGADCRAVGAACFDDAAFLTSAGDPGWHATRRRTVNALAGTARAEQKAPTVHQTGARPGLACNKADAWRPMTAASVASDAHLRRNSEDDPVDQVPVVVVEPPSGVDGREADFENRADNSLRNPSSP